MEPDKLIACGGCVGGTTECDKGEGLRGVWHPAWIPGLLGDTTIRLPKMIDDGTNSPTQTGHSFRHLAQSPAPRGNPTVPFINSHVSFELAHPQILGQGAQVPRGTYN
jgi:hypothetical protein